MGIELSKAKYNSYVLSSVGCVGLSMFCIAMEILMIGVIASLVISENSSKWKITRYFMVPLFICSKSSFPCKTEMGKRQLLHIFCTEHRVHGSNNPFQLPNYMASSRCKISCFVMSSLLQIHGPFSFSSLPTQGLFLLCTKPMGWTFCPVSYTTWTLKALLKETLLGLHIMLIKITLSSVYLSEVDNLLGD